MTKSTLNEDLKNEIKAYCWSISSIIALALTSPCSSYRYSFTHMTKWSLNVPLITWWSKSGVRRSWMSAQGNPWVNSCQNSVSKCTLQILVMIVLTNISACTLKSVQRIPGSQVLIRKSVVVWVHCHAPGASSFSGQAVHLQTSELLVMIHYAINLLGAPALDNASQPNLFWVISNVGSKAICGKTKMPIRTFDHFCSCHPILQRIEYVH